MVEPTDGPLPDSERPVGSGTRDQLRDDVARLRDAGVDEVLFDVAFARDNDGSEAVLRYLEPCARLPTEAGTPRGGKAGA